MTQDEDALHMEVYARFGLAVYFAQVLEHGLVNAMLCVSLLPKSSTLAKDRAVWCVMVDDFMDRKFELTLGRMINEFRESGDVPSDLEAQLDRALAMRNWLVHDYFRERVGEFASPDGCRRMSEELEAARALLAAADQALERFVRPVRERYGITDSWIERE